MKIDAYLYAPPGRGVCYTKQLSMDDAQMPQGTQLCVARSVKALKHFWPTAANLAPVSTVQITHDLKRNVEFVKVMGEWPKSRRKSETAGPIEWQVTWRTEARVADDANLIHAISSLGVEQLSRLAEHRASGVQHYEREQRAA